MNETEIKLELDKKKKKKKKKTVLGYLSPFEIISI